MQNIWKEYDLNKNNSFESSIGETKIICKYENTELKLAYTHNHSSDTFIPKDDDWQRWALKNKSVKIRIHPVFPDRPVVVKPENVFKIVKNSEAKIYVRVPLWIKIELMGKKHQVLTEVPSVILSNTWFGNFFQGELCYWISSGANRKFTIDPKKDYLAICPINLINKANEDLVVEKISLRVTNLCLYFDGKQLWSDDTNVYYTGSMEESEIEASGQPPVESPAAKLISEQREKHNKTFTAKTFSSLKELPGLGIFMK